MVPNHKDIGDLFKQQIDAVDFSMSENAWSAIEPHLPQKEKKRRGIIWFWFATLLCISGLGLTIYNNSITNLVPDLANKQDHSTVLDAFAALPMASNKMVHMDGTGALVETSIS